MNSCIYTLKLIHERKAPRRNFFKYAIYMAYIDLDELESISKKIFLFGYNKWNALSFFDKDHFKFVFQKSKNAEIIARETVNFEADKYINKNTKERLKVLIEELQLGFKLDKAYLLTNLRNFGYIFTPVSFYYCFDAAGKFRAMFSEVNNTFGDQKMYYCKIDNPEAELFSDTQKKNYYISPFINYDNNLHWQFKIPGPKIMMAIDSIKDDNVELHTVLTGNRRELSNFSLVWAMLRYPMVTLTAIALIHYQALKLFIKKIKFYRKDEADNEIIKAISNKK
ncbi:MAG: DUF1365 domain-containing protein [Candidatus Falkowbacteria bacterium]|nr:MAG: DUF1365 domain-containing protein [Candidatus Falkowbacteria bacterium]